MKKLIVSLSVLIMIVGFSQVYADEAKSDTPEKTDENAKTVEKQVKEILDPQNRSLKFREKIKKLVEIGEPAVPYLVEALNGGVSDFTAASALAEIRGIKCLPDLFNAYNKHVEGSYGHGLASVIKNLGNEALQFLYGKLADDDETVRYDAVHLISYFRNADTLGVLKTQYKKEKSNKVKLHIIHVIYAKDEESQKEYLGLVHEMLKSADDEVKREALHVTRWIKDDSQIDLIIKMFDDDSLIIRKAAINVIVSFEQEKTINAVIKAIKHKDKNTGKFAVSVLSIRRYENKELKKVVINALIEELKNKDAEMRAEVVRCLRFFDELSIIPHLEEIANNDPDAKICESAKTAIEAIKKNKERSDEWEKFRNIEKPQNSDETEKEENDPVHKQWNEIVSKIILDGLNYEEFVDEVAKLGEDVVPILEKALDSENVETSMLATKSLAKIQGVKCVHELMNAYIKVKRYDQLSTIKTTICSFKDDALPYLYNELDNDTERVRIYTIEFIVEINVNKALNKLKEQYEKDSSNLVKLRILYFIYKIDEQNQKEYLEYVHKMLNSEEEDIKVEAIYVVGEIEDKTQIDFLIKCIDDESSRIRSSVIQNLIKFENEKAILAVVKALKHKEYSTRNAAALSLQSEDVRIKELHKTVIKSLLEVMDDENSNFRCYLLVPLSSYDDPAITAKLEQIAEKDPERHIRLLAKKILNSKQGKRVNEGIDEDDKRDDSLKPKTNDDE